MDAVCGKGCEAHRVEPEEELVIDGEGLVGEGLPALVLPVDEYECDVGGDCRDDYEERILEGRRRGRAHDEVSDDAAARGRQERQDVDTEDVHLFADTCHRTGHCKSDSADDVGDQDEEFGIHSRHYICFRAE